MKFIKIKIISDSDQTQFEQHLQEFVRNKEIADIKFAHDDEGFHALIMYRNDYYA